MKNPGGHGSWLASARTILAIIFAAGCLGIAPSALAADWNQFRHASGRAGLNPDEHVLNANNVAGLVKIWSVDTKSPVNSSAAVVGGVATGGSIYSTPSVYKGAVYVGTLNGNFYAVDAKTGTQRWMAGLHHDLWGSQAVANGAAYVVSGGTGKYKCYAFNAANGHLIWSTSPFGGELGSPPSVANGVVYFGSKNGNVYALDAGAGSQLWSYPTNDQVIASPAIVNGKVYVGSYDGSLYVFGLKKKR